MAAIIAEKMLAAGIDVVPPEVHEMMVLDGEIKNDVGPL